MRTLVAAVIVGALLLAGYSLWGGEHSPVTPPPAPTPPPEADTLPPEAPDAPSPDPGGVADPRDYMHALLRIHLEPDISGMRLHRELSLVHPDDRAAFVMERLVSIPCVNGRRPPALAVMAEDILRRFELPIPTEAQLKSLRRSPRTEAARIALADKLLAGVDLNALAFAVGEAWLGAIPASTGDVLASPSKEHLERWRDEADRFRRSEPFWLNENETAILANYFGRVGDRWYRRVDSLHALWGTYDLTAKEMEARSERFLREHGGSPLGD